MGRHEEGVPDRLDEPAPPGRAGQSDACGQNGAYAGKHQGEQLRFLTNAIIEKAKEKYKDWSLEA